MTDGYPLQSNDGRDPRRLLPLLDRRAGPHRAAAAACSSSASAEDRIYLDHGLTGTNRARPGLDQALAAVRDGDTLVVPKLDRLARSVPDARDIGDALAARGIKLSLGGQVYDPTDPMGKMFFNILATFAEFEVDLLRMRTREGMAVARAKGKLRPSNPSCRPSSRPSCAACTAPASTPSPTSPNCSTSPDPPSTAPSHDRGALTVAFSAITTPTLRLGSASGVRHLLMTF